MSQDLTINGINYTGVPSLKVKITGTSNYATFYDVSDTTVSSTSYVLSGYYYYNSSGSRVAGTMSNRTSTYSATSSLDTTNSRVRLQIPATARYTTAAYLYATYSAMATTIGLTSDKLLSSSTILGVTGSVYDAGSYNSSSYISDDDKSEYIRFGVDDKLYTKVAATNFYSTYSSLASAIGLTANKIVTGNTILGIQGTGGGVSPTYTVTTANVNDVANSKTFYKATSTSSVTLSTGTLQDWRASQQVLSIYDTYPSSIYYNSSNSRFIIVPPCSITISGDYTDVNFDTPAQGNGIAIDSTSLKVAIGLMDNPGTTISEQAAKIVSGYTIAGVAGTGGGSSTQTYYIELANGYGNTSYCYVQKNGTTQTNSFYAETGDTLRFYVGSGTKAVYYNGTSQSLTSNAWTMTVSDTYGDLRILFDYVSGTRSIIRISNNEYVYLQNKTVTSNGTVTADNGYDGLGTVTVSIPVYDGSVS